MNIHSSGAPFFALTLYCPEIGGNVGTLMRLARCWNFPLNIIEPLGFPWSDSKLRRAHMDYASPNRVIKYASWESYRAQISKSDHGSQGLGNFAKGNPSPRLILLTPHKGTTYTQFAFLPGDNIIVGRESTGFPQAHYGDIHEFLTIPMYSGARSLNMALCAAMVMAEALRQHHWPLDSWGVQGAP